MYDCHSPKIIAQAANDGDCVRACSKILQRKHTENPMNDRLRLPYTNTFLAANASGLSSMPMENVWIGYWIPTSRDNFTASAVVRLESRPPA